MITGVYANYTGGKIFPTSYQTLGTLINMYGLEIQGVGAGSGDSHIYLSGDGIIIYTDKLGVWDATKTSILLGYTGTITIGTTAFNVRNGIITSGAYTPSS